MDSPEAYHGPSRTDRQISLKRGDGRDAPFSRSKSNTPGEEASSGHPADLAPQYRFLFPFMRVRPRGGSVRSSDLDLGWPGVALEGGGEVGRGGVGLVEDDPVAERDR